MSRYLSDRIAANPRVDVLVRCEVRELIGGEVLEGVSVEDLDTREQRTVQGRALFVFIGGEPHTRWLRGRVALDDGGYVLTGQDALVASGASRAENGANYVGNAARRSPQMLETSLPGVFAAGDVRSGSTQRVAAAVGDGAIAIRQAHQLLSGRLEAVHLSQTYASSK